MFRPELLGDFDFIGSSPTTHNTADQLIFPGQYCEFDITLLFNEDYRKEQWKRYYIKWLEGFNRRWRRSKKERLRKRHQKEKEKRKQNRRRKRLPRHQRKK